MKRVCKCLVVGVAVAFGSLCGVAAACPVTTGDAVVAPVAQIVAAQVPVAAASVAAPVVAAPGVVVPSVAVPAVAAPVVVNPAVPVVSSIAVPAVSVLSTPVIERVRVRSSRQFRTPIRSLLFR